ncbi:unnamed protein product [Dibothriocephalus latus]|uniref:Uncharacterized protein n=1 Tax=Dibothriocephalus latus TaxID=60516 RepID=A0A3P7N380_DIBLA|nr:unnamed protein product [Dibothriocephalus latus]
MLSAALIGEFMVACTPYISSFKTEPQYGFDSKSRVVCCSVDFCGENHELASCSRRRLKTHSILMPILSFGRGNKLENELFE